MRTWPLLFRLLLIELTLIWRTWPLLFRLLLILIELTSIWPFFLSPLRPAMGRSAAVLCRMLGRKREMQRSRCSIRLAPMTPRFFARKIYIRSSGQLISEGFVSHVWIIWRPVGWDGQYLQTWNNIWVLRMHIVIFRLQSNVIFG